MSEDEPGLIQRAQQGDADACAALYDRHYEAVYRYCYYRVGDVALAQDVASEVFVRMVESLGTFRQRGRPLLAWLYTIARNLIADVYRREGQAYPLALDEALVVEDNDPAHVAERRLLAGRLAAAFDRLTEKQRQVILFKFIEGRNNTEVARLLGKPEGAVKSLQHRALAALRRILIELHWHEA